MSGPAWGELPPSEPGKIFWWAEPTTYFVDVRGGGRQIAWGHVRAGEDDKPQKRSGLFGIFSRLRTKPNDPGYNIAKRVIHSVGEEELRRTNREAFRPDPGPQVMPGPRYYEVPQVFDPPQSGHYDELGRWHNE